MAGIVRRLEWDRLPRDVVPIDRQSSQARGLRFAVNLGASLAVDVADGVSLTLLDGGSSAGPKRAGFFGVGQVFDHAAYNSCLYAPSWTNTTNEASVCLVFHTNIAGSVGEVWELGGTDTDHFPFGSGAYADPFWSTRWMSNVAAPAGASFLDPVRLVFTVKDGAQKAYWNGRLWHSNTATGGFTLPATLKLFKPRTGGIGFAAFAWDRFLDEREACDIGSGSLRFLAPELTNVPMAASGGGAAALAGGATSGATATGALTTAIPILGAAVSGATASGSLSTAISLAGASATISATAAGNLTATIRLAGDAVAGALAAGGLATGIPLAGGGSVGGAGAGDLSTGSGLVGAGAAGAAGTGVLTTQITLSGAAIAQAIASGALTTTPAGLAGDGTSSSSGSGALSTAIPLAGAAAVSVVGTGGLVTAIPLAGAATVAVSATGDLVVSLGLAGAALISAIGSGALLTSITLNGAAVTGAVGAGALSGAALHASPWRTVTSLARVRSVRATARVRRCIAGVR